MKKFVLLSFGLLVLFVIAGVQADSDESDSTQDPDSAEDLDSAEELDSAQDPDSARDPDSAQYPDSAQDSDSAEDLDSAEELDSAQDPDSARDPDSAQDSDSDEDQRGGRVGGNQRRQGLVRPQRGPWRLHRGQEQRRPRYDFNNDRDTDFNNEWGDFY